MVLGSVSSKILVLSISFNTWGLICLVSVLLSNINVYDYTQSSVVEHLLMNNNLLH